MNIDIKTERLRIRPLSPDTTWIRDIARWLNDPDIVRFSEQRYQTHTVESQVIYINSFVGADQYLGIWYCGCLIGTMSTHVDEHNNVANVGIMIGDVKYWNRGFGFEAWVGVCNQLLHVEKIRKIEAGFMSCNVGMRNVCAKYGMIQAGILKDHFLYHKVPMDLIMCEKLK